MTILQILTAAAALPRCSGAPARDIEGDPVHPLSPAAVKWDAEGALHKTVGAQDTDDYMNSLRCLGVGAMQICKQGITEVSDTGNAGLIHNMWRFATLAARQVEVHMGQAVAA